MTFPLFSNPLLDYAIIGGSGGDFPFFINSESFRSACLALVVNDGRGKKIAEKKSLPEILMTSYVKQENRQEWTGRGTMETTVHCQSGLPFPLTRDWGQSRATVASADKHTQIHTYNWQAQQLFLPCCQSRASRGPVPERWGGRAEGRGCHFFLLWKRAYCVQGQLLGEKTMWITLSGETTLGIS